MINFDHNATTPLSVEAREAWVQAAEQFSGNPSSPHRLGSRAEHALTTARENVAAILGCSPLDLLWTSGATEASNTVLQHFAWEEGGRPVWISAVEHASVREPAMRAFGKRLRFIPVTADGIVSLDWMRTELERELPVLVAVMALNNETGVIQPWHAIQMLCRSAGVPYFCDAAQWLGKVPASGIGGCDFLSGAAHKFGGPRGIGLLKIPESVHLRPLIVGGPQEDRRRAGTENVAGAVALAAALSQREKWLASGPITERLQWRRRFEERVEALLPGARILGQTVERVWNTTLAIMPEGDCEQRWVVRLDRAGFAVSTGSACASGREQPSHVLEAMGVSPLEAARALRFSSGPETAEADWEKLLEALVATQQTLSARKAS